MGKQLLGSSDDLMSFCWDHLVAGLADGADAPPPRVAACTARYRLKPGETVEQASAIVARRLGHLACFARIRAAVSGCQ